MRISPLTLIGLLTGIYTVLKGQLLDIYVGTVINAAFLGNSTPQTILESPDGNLIILTEDYIYIVTVSTDDVTLAISNVIRHPTKLTPLYDAVLLNNTHLIYSNKDTCLRIFDLNTGDISVFAGSCGISGSYNGVLLNSTFSRIYGLLKIDDKIYLAQSDNRTGLIRLLKGGQVSTLHTETALSAELGYMTTCNGVHIYLTTAYDALVRINIDSNETLSLTQSDRTPRGLTMLSLNILLFADFENGKLVINNLESATVSMICNGGNASINGNRMTCSFNGPFSIFLYKDQILVGEKGSIRTIPLFSIIEANSYDNKKCYYTSRFVPTTQTNTTTSQQGMSTTVQTTPDILTGQTTPSISNIQVRSMIGTEFLGNQSVQGIIDLPGDRLLILTACNLYITSVTILANGFAMISDGFRPLTNKSSEFTTLLSALLLNDTHVLVTQYGLHCLKVINLNNGDINTFAGNCSFAGDGDGILTSAMFNYPQGILMVHRVIYVTSILHRPIRVVEGEQVSTLPIANSFYTARYPRFLSACDGIYIYLTFLNGLARFNIMSNNLEVISGSTESGNGDGDTDVAEFGQPYGLMMIAPYLILVVDNRNNALRVVDVNQSSVVSICDGYRLWTDGTGTSCSFNSPYAVHLYKSLVLIGESGKIRTITRRSLITDENYEMLKCSDLNVALTTDPTVPSPTSSLSTISVVSDNTTITPVKTTESSQSTVSTVLSTVSTVLSTVTPSRVTTLGASTQSTPTRPITTRSMTTQSTPTTHIVTRLITTPSMLTTHILTQSMTTQGGLIPGLNTVKIAVGVVVTLIAAALIILGVYFLTRKYFTRVHSSKVGRDSSVIAVMSKPMSQHRHSVPMSIERIPPSPITMSEASQRLSYSYTYNQPDADYPRPIRIEPPPLQDRSPAYSSAYVKPQW